MYLVEFAAILWCLSRWSEALTSQVQTSKTFEAIYKRMVKKSKYEVCKEPRMETISNHVTRISAKSWVYDRTDLDFQRFISEIQLRRRSILLKPKQLP